MIAIKNLFSLTSLKKKVNDSYQKLVFINLHEAVINPCHAQVVITKGESDFIASAEITGILKVTEET